MDNFCDISEQLSEERPGHDLATFEKHTRLDTADQQYLTEHLADQLSLDADAVIYLANLARLSGDRASLGRLADAAIRVAVKNKGRGKSKRSAPGAKVTDETTA